MQQTMHMQIATMHMQIATKLCFEETKDSGVSTIYEETNLSMALHYLMHIKPHCIIILFMLRGTGYFGHHSLNTDIYYQLMTIILHIKVW